MRKSKFSSINSIPSVSIIQPGHQQIFVGGIHPETTMQEFNVYFKAFGAVSHMSFKGTYGFVTYTSKAVADGVVIQKHFFHGKECGTKLNSPENRGKMKKFFLGGLAPGTTEEMLRTHFIKYGKVVDVRLFIERGYGWVSFPENDCKDDEILTIRFHEINGKSVEVKIHEKRVVGSNRGGFVGRIRFSQNFSPYDQQMYNYSQMPVTYGSYNHQPQTIQYAYIQPTTTVYSGDQQAVYNQTTTALVPQTYAQESQHSYAVQSTAQHVQQYPQQPIQQQTITPAAFTNVLEQVQQAYQAKQAAQINQNVEQFEKLK